MKLRYTSLAIAILLSAAIVAGVGVYLKYDLLKPLLSLPGMEYYAEKSVLELPFLMYSDEVLKFMVEDMLSAPPDNSLPPENTPPQNTDPDVPPTTAPVTQPTTNPTQPSTTEPTQPPITKPTQPPTTAPTKPTEPDVPDVPSGYPDFYFPDGKPDSWFDDVLFIGDSRTVGLKMYARSGNAEYFCDVGATVFNIQTKVLSDNGFSNQTLEELLSSKTYGKIFINLGLNEIGYPLTSVYNRYEQLVDFVKQKQPNAIIILQGVMSVTRQKASQADYFSPSTIATLNNKIRSYANGKNVFYIDCNTYLADTEGYLYNSLTNDGYHPTGTGYRIWHNWIHWAVGQLSL